MGLRHSLVSSIAGIERLPTAGRAVLGYYGSGEMSLSEGVDALRLQSHIEERKENFLQQLFENVEQSIEEETGEDSAETSYDTKLTFPAELALGKIYEDAQEQLPAGYDVTDTENNGTDPIENTEQYLRLREGERFSELVMGLLVEGDMRDAIQDEEYGDFETTASIEGAEVAEMAQQTLFDHLQPRLDEYPEGVRDAYERAVDLSMEHQEEDEGFRELFEEAKHDVSNAEDIMAPYISGETESRFSLDWNSDLPFFASQYERVGVLYDGMFEMYDEAGINMDDDFKRAVVLSTIGAQIWLDDVDDLEEDWSNNQLTPVTAEAVVAEDPREAYERIVSIKDEYLDSAREYARASDSHLASIGIEYIDRKGEELDLMSSLNSIDDAELS